MKKYLLILLITTIFSQEGEIINAEAQQRVDGSGIVDVTYELLPDETFPSFEVTADLSYTPSFVYYEFEGEFQIQLRLGYMLIPVPFHGYLWK